MKEPITLTPDNIVKIFKEVNRKLNKHKIPKNIGGWINTPYGYLTWDSKKQYRGSRKAIKWFKEIIGERRNQKKNKFLRKHGDSLALAIGFIIAMLLTAHYIFK